MALTGRLGRGCGCGKVGGVSVGGEGVSGRGDADEVEVGWRLSVEWTAAGWRYRQAEMERREG